MAAATADPHAAATGRGDPVRQRCLRRRLPAGGIDAGAAGDGVDEAGEAVPALRAADEADGAVDGGVHRDAVEVDLGHREAEGVHRGGRRALLEIASEERVDAPEVAERAGGERLRPGALGGREAGERAGVARLVGEGDARLEHAREESRRRPAGGEARRRHESGHRKVRPARGIEVCREAATPAGAGISAASASRARMRFSVLGWVEKRLSIRPPCSGLMMKSGAEVGLRSALGMTISWA